MSYIQQGAAAGGAGTVTSVGQTINSGASSGIFTVTGSPVIAAGTLDIATAGTSGGIPYFSSGTVISSSAALTASRLVLGGGAGATPTVATSLGTTTTLLHGNAAGAPTFGAVALTTDVTGVLPPANGGVAAVATAGQGYFWGAGRLSPPIGSAAGSASITGAAQQLRVYQFVLPISISVSHITITISAAGAGGSTATVGIYDAAGTTKLIDSGTFDGTSATTQTKTITPVTLNPGTYWYATSASTQTTLTAVAINTPATAMNTTFSNQAVRIGTAANAATAGVLPATLGVVTSVALNEVMAMFEP